MRVATLLFALLACGVCSASIAPDVVRISGGLISGVRNTSRNVRYWKNVPFGESAGGQNRFKTSVPKKPWSGTLNCTDFGPGCVSIHHNPDTAPVQSEDCLNLNVYAPLKGSLQANASLPVVVFLYGGGFTEGDNQGPFGMYDGQWIAGHHNVVLITVNYRLGAFGYMTTDQLKGNYGLDDQRLALKWTQQNAHVFGGNGSHITLQGESAGAMSVGLHLVSPDSEGLFQAAIMESNPLALDYDTNKEMAIYGATVCKLLGCHGGENCDQACLEKATTANVSHAWDKAAGNTLDYIIANFGHFLNGFLDFKPTVDGVQVPDNVIPLLDSGKMHNVPILIGTNTNEASTFIYDAVKSPLPMFLFDLALDALFGDKAKLVKPFYPSKDYKDLRYALSRVFTHYWFRCSSERFAAAAQKKGSATYVYRYNHVFSGSSIWTTFGLPSICATHVCHASELPLIFHFTEIHNAQINVTMTPGEVKLSENMISYWENFVKTHNPNGPTTAFSWPAWDESTRPNIVLQEELAVESSQALCSMWDEVGYSHNL